MISNEQMGVKINAAIGLAIFTIQDGDDKHRDKKVIDM